ncbi:MAG: transcription termination factor Rho [Olsenella sp.]|jgi:transcription termination factor Rho|nr:transcription termination factor Rho [Olsenella sp.]
MAEDNQEESSEPTQSEEAPKPRRRRTTRKVAAKKGEEGTPEQAELQLQPATASEATVEEKPKRRRGRPRKVKVAEDAPEQGEAPQPQVSEETPKAERAANEGGSNSTEEAPAAERPKRRRGRPRKVKPDEEVPADVPQATEEGGRPTDAAKAQDEAGQRVLGAPAATLAEADAATSDAGEQEGDQHQQQRHGEDHQQRRRRGRQQGNDRQGSHEGQQSAHNGGNGTYGNGGSRNSNRRRNRRDRRQEQQVEPSLTRDEVSLMKVAELREKAQSLGIPYVGVRKKDLAEAVYEAAALAEGFRPVQGILEMQNEGYGFLRTGNYMAGDGDAFVHQQLIRQYGLRPGDEVKGSVSPARNNSKYPPLHHIDSINGRPPEEMRGRPRFRDLTPIFPNERLIMEHGRDSITGRAIDLVAPIGKGQRGLIVSPPKAGKTTVLKKICQSIAANNPEVHLFCLLVDERPEEVTDMERSIRGTVVASTFDMPASNHTAVSELVIEHAKRLVEMGEDVVVVLDSITRLARAYNLAMPASGRILSGGVDSAALYPPKKFLGAARNIEGGGSLTILASALVDTGSKMDEVIFEEFKGTGNMELKLDRDLADRRIYPAIDPIASGTRNEELLLDPELQPFVWGIRRVLANMNNTERAATALVKGLRATNDNAEFLIRSAKKAQMSDYVS